MRLGHQQKRVLIILEEHPHSTITEVASIIYKQQVLRRTKQYNSICRSFHLLEAQELIEKEGTGQIKWHVRSKSP